MAIFELARMRCVFTLCVFLSLWVCCRELSFCATPFISSSSVIVCLLGRSSAGRCDISDLHSPGYYRLINTPPPPTAKWMAIGMARQALQICGNPLLASKIDCSHSQNRSVPRRGQMLRDRVQVNFTRTVLCFHLCV